jgi:hypothetical protein
MAPLQSRLRDDKRRVTPIIVDAAAARHDGNGLPHQLPLA